MVQQIRQPNNGFEAGDAVEEAPIAGLHALFILAKDTVEVNEGPLTVLVKLCKELVAVVARG